MYIESLLQQKDLLLRQMKDLLLVNDTFNLQKLKNEYDYIINRIDNLNFGKIKTNYLNNTETGGETPQIWREDHGYFVRGPGFGRRSRKLFHLT